MGVFDFLKGKDGKDGKDAKPCIPCKDGYTPVKGVDYFDGKDGMIGGFGYKTVLDYGAKLYLTKEAAIAGESFHEAGQKMLDETGTCLLPPYGWMKLDDSVIMWYPHNAVKSLGFGNKGLNIVANKPISMFIPLTANQQITGFTAWYIGGEIKQECSVVKIGDSRNTGAYLQNRDTDYWWKSWPHKTQINDLLLDFDFSGDGKYYCSRKMNHPYDYNENFVPNGNAHAVWVDFDREDEDIYSHCHNVKVRGYWSYVNTGIKITRKSNSEQSLNTFDIDVTIWGARQFCNIKGIDFGTIKIMGQEQDMLNWNHLDPLYANSNKQDWEEFTVPLWEVQGSSLKSQIFIYDVHKGDGVTGWRSAVHQVNGQYNVNLLDASGWYDILPYGLQNTDLNDSVLVNNGAKRS